MKPGDRCEMLACWGTIIPKPAEAETYMTIALRGGEVAITPPIVPKKKEKPVVFANDQAYNGMPYCPDCQTVYIS